MVTTTVGPIVLILSILILLVLWVRSKNAGWAFPTALAIFLGAHLKGNIPVWTSITFWSLIAIGAILFIASKPVAFKRFAIASFVIATLAAGIVFIGPMFQKSPAATKIQPPITATIPNTTIQQRADVIMQGSHWLPGTYSFKIDQSIISGKPGQGAFNVDGAKNPKDIVDFLKSNKPEANVLLNSILKDSGASKEQVLDESNWVAVQSLIDFRYDGNTMLKDGKVVDAGTKSGGKGEIFLIFSPLDGKTAKLAAMTFGSKADKAQAKLITVTKNDVAVRGPCDNVQTAVPVPVVTPTPTTSTPTPLTPKSSKIEDYQRPGTDNTTDSGTGVKPIVPVVTTPAETTPPPVETSKVGNNSIIDTPNKVPGSETGTTAPGATPPVTGTTPRVIPPVEAGANPPTTTITVNDTPIPSTGTNTGDPGNPF